MARGRSTTGSPSTSVARRGRGVKVVRRQLSDGTVKEYRYDRQALAQKRRNIEDAHALHKLGRAFMASEDYARLSDMWKYQVRYYLAIIAHELGWVGKSDLAKRSIRGEFYRLRDLHRAQPHKADKIIEVLRRLLSWAYERGEIDINHALKIDKIGRQGTHRDAVWLPKHERAFLAKAPPAIAAVYRLALYTALRQSDLCRLEWSNFDGRWLVVTPKKTTHSTGVVVHIPVYALPPLAETIRSLKRVDGQTRMLLTESGIPWRVANLKHHWYATEEAAGLLGSKLRFHDLRGTAITRMLEAGCTEAFRNDCRALIPQEEGILDRNPASNYADPRISVNPGERMAPNDKTFGGAISDARKAKGWALKDLAAKVLREDEEPISPQYLNDIEHDRRSPSSDRMVQQFADALGIDRDWLYYLAGRWPKHLRDENLTPKQVSEVMVAFRRKLDTGKGS